MGNTHSFSCITDGCGKYEPEFAGELESLRNVDGLEVVEPHDQMKPSAPTNSPPPKRLDDNEQDIREKPAHSPFGLFLEVDQDETEAGVIAGDSPRSIESGESVMTAISPTKDKTIKKRRQRIVSPIQTKFNHSLEVSIGQRESGSQQSIEQTVLDEVYFCIVNGNIERLSELVAENGLDLAQIQFQGLEYSPLHVAVIHDQQAMVQFLLDRGVDINLRDKDGQTANYLAYTLGRFDITNLLVAIKSAEFSSSPFSPYGNSTGAASRIGSADSYDSRAHYDMVPTAATHTRLRQDSDDVIVVARDNSFRSAHSIDFPVQHPHKSRHRRFSSGSNAGAPVNFPHRRSLSKVPSFGGDPMQSEPYKVLPHWPQQTVQDASDVFGTIHTTCSFDEEEEFDTLNRGQSFKLQGEAFLLPEGGESSRTPFQSPVAKWAVSEWPASRPHFATASSRSGLPPIHGAGYFAPSPADSSQHGQHDGTDFIGGPPGSTGAIYIEDHTGTDGSSLTNTNDFSSDGGTSASVLIHGVAGAAGVKKPLRKRLRKAAGKVLSFMVPHHRGSDSNGGGVSGSSGGYNQM